MVSTGGVGLSMVIRQMTELHALCLSQTSTALHSRGDSLGGKEEWQKGKTWSAEQHGDEGADVSSER